MLELGNEICRDLLSLARSGTHLNGETGNAIWRRAARHSVILLNGYSRPPLDELGPLFVKARGPERFGEFVSLDREKSLFELTPIPRVLARALPKLHFSDQHGDLLVFTGLVDSIPLSELQPEDTLYEHSALGLARIVAALHLWRPEGMSAVNRLTSPVMTYDHISPQHYAMSRGRFDLLSKYVFLSPALNQALRGLEWRETCLIHGDLKIDNVLCDKQSGAIAVTDWELFGRGDPEWDCGSVIGSAYYAALIGTACGAHRSAAEQAQTWVEAFLSEYGKAVPQADLARILTYAAYWLVNRAQIELGSRVYATQTDVKAIYAAHALVPN